MNEAIALRWIAALRSGEYTQGQGQLCIEVKKKVLHCPLGVLCELACKDEKLHDGAPLIRSRKAGGGAQYVYDGSAGMLPPRVAAWADIQTPSFVALAGKTGHRSIRGDYPGGRDIIQDNDEGKSFAEIADIIEKHWEAM